MSCLIHGMTWLMIKDHLFGSLRLNPWVAAVQGHALAGLSSVLKQEANALVYPNTFQFVWLTCKECALVNVFERQGEGWALSLEVWV